MSARDKRFTANILQWFNLNRRDFSWREDGVTPFQTLIAELMLRKTKSENVEKVFPRFIKKYPTPQSVSNTSLSKLEKEIKSLGLHKQRAAAIKDICEIINKEFGGIVPDRVEDLERFPHVGKYTANAVLCFAFNHDLPIVDTNISRIIGRVFGIPYSGDNRRDKVIWKRARELLPSGRARDFNYALLDLGARACTSRKPKHELCPLSKLCVEYAK